MTTDPAFPTLPAEKSNARTEAALARLHKAMRDIEAEIAAYQGVYPFNHGRVTQSELCRRADVKKATLQNPLHKDTTRVGVIRWLDALSAQLAHTRDGTRERVTEVADGLAAEVQRLTLALAAAEQRLVQLEAENAALRHPHG
ncbi:hypothetical protein [Rhodoferax sp.]|uniref:hypothetical protein n=1 Tax=Rhodoferax sp. TaxID=50421 RepID=UPI0025ED64AF|nr:hypothetical protein [Rhodoferax sp.]